MSPDTVTALVYGAASLTGLIVIGPILRMVFTRPAWEKSGTCPDCGKPFSQCSIALWG